MSVLSFVIAALQLKRSISSSLGGALSSYLPGRSPCTTVVSVLSFVVLQPKWSVSSSLGGALSSYLPGRIPCTTVVSVLSFVIVALQLKWRLILSQVELSQVTFLEGVLVQL